MNKILKRVLIGLGVLIALLLIAFPILRNQTKKASPEQTASQSYGAAQATVAYSSPSKRERVIFGELVPFGEVWRTGANEATTFVSTGDLMIGGQTLPAGEYTLWTIPGPTEWTVIWNKKDYFWGVASGAKASRDPEFDVLQVVVPVEMMPSPQEMFSISFDNAGMTLSWDQTKVMVPIQGA